MSRVTIILLIIAVILVGVLIALYFIGKRLQARQEQSNEQIQAMKQPMTLLVIDKKRLKLKESGMTSSISCGSTSEYRIVSVPNLWYSYRWLSAASAPRRAKVCRMESRPLAIILLRRALRLSFA